MRVMMLALALLLAGCSGPSSDDADEEQAPAGEDHAEHGGDAPLVEGNTTSPLLASVDCDMPDRVVFGPYGPSEDGTTSHCSFAPLDIPEGAASMRLTLTYTVTASPDDIGLRLADHGQCDTVDGGPGCNVAAADGPSPLVLDVDAETLDGFELADLDAYASGHGVDTTFDLEIMFFSSDAPAGAV